MLIEYTMSYLHELAFKEDANVYELLTIALAFSILWLIVFSISRVLLGKISYGKPWLVAMCVREYERNKEGFAEWGIKTKDDAIEIQMKHWPHDQVVFIQHLCGALLAVPSVFALSNDTAWTSSLAVLGILSEVGWEIEDTVECVYKVATGAMPLSYFPYTLMHHSLAAGMGLPMILSYRTLMPMHWLCFDLQMGASMTVFASYAATLDITKRGDLRQFKVINFVMLAAMVWTRALHWPYCCAQIFARWYHDEAWAFMAAGVIPLLAFTFFNLALCVIPMYKRFVKFLHKSADYDALPVDTPDEDRRKSMSKMKEMASLLIAEGMMDIVDRTELFLESLEERKKIEKRKTLPNFKRASMMRNLNVRHGKSAPAMKID